jgi:Tol biopolymer transport system component/DNA-binding winged helix-turn-helix (wHTH) protein
MQRKRAGVIDCVHPGQAEVNIPAQQISFGEFELDVRAGELRKGERRIRLQEQPFQILLMLLEHPGEVVTREEICNRLWPNGTIVEFDHSIGTAVKKLRQALNDEADSPRYVETLPRRGFRFVFPHVEVLDAEPAVGKDARDSAAVEPAPQQTARLGDPVITPARGAGLVTSTTAGSGTSFPLRAKRQLWLVLASAAVLLAAVALFANWWRHRSRSETLDESSLAQVTTSIGADIMPSLSPDGSAVAYSSDKNGSFEIYVKTIAHGGREIQLTTDGNENFEPAWSPDGTQIAYYSRKKDGIWLIPALGGTVRRLTDFGSWPAWSPDSSRIVFQSQGMMDYSQTAYAAMPPSMLWVVQVQGGALTELTQPGNPSGGHGAPSWSPDGKHIAFSSTSTGLAEIWMVPANGGTPQRLVAGVVCDPVYGPGGRYLYFSQTHLESNQQKGTAPTFALMRLALTPEGAAHGNPELVKESGTVIYKGLHFSANGGFLAFSAIADNNNLQSVRVSPATGEAIGDPAPFTRDTAMRKTSPRFSPDGSQIAYSLVQSGENIAVWMVDADGKNAHPVGVMAANSVLPGWLPGDGRLTFQGEQNGREVIEAFDLSTGATSVLREFGENDAPLRISPDGKQVAYGKRQGGSVNVWVAPVNKDGPAKQLTFGKGLMSYGCWSPDGKTIGFEVRLEVGLEIAIVPSTGGPVTMLTADHQPSLPNDWSPDGDKIVFAGLRNGAWNVWWVSRSTRQERQVTHYTRDNIQMLYPAWSPRGDQIVYEYSETTGNIWTMRVK